MKVKRLLVHDEFQIRRYANGIQLVKPTKNPARNIHINSNNQLDLIVNNVLKFDFNVYFLNTDSAIINMNESNARLIGSNSIKDAISKTAHSFLRDKQEAAVTINNNL